MVHDGREVLRRLVTQVSSPVRWDLCMTAMAELGATALYLNPVFTSSSNHKYDTEDYRQVDPHLGGNAALEPSSPGRKTRRTTARSCVSVKVNSTAGVATAPVAVFLTVKLRRNASPRNLLNVELSITTDSIFCTGFTAQLSGRHNRLNKAENCG